MKLYFQNSQEIEREIGNPNNYEEASQIIDEFLEERNFLSYYSRVWKDGYGRYYFDVGSHTEFFILDTCGEIIEELKNL